MTSLLFDSWLSTAKIWTSKATFIREQLQLKDKACPSVVYHIQNNKIVSANSSTLAVI